MTATTKIPRGGLAFGEDVRHLFPLEQRGYAQGGFVKQMRWMAALLVSLMASSCATMKAPPPLRAGVTPNYPPLIMRQGDKLAGAECDFAAQLAAELGRPLQLVPVPWELQLEELEADAGEDELAAEVAAKASAVNPC